MSSIDDVGFMKLALQQADLAALDGDVPVGCVVVESNGNVIARGRNRRERDADPTAHGEIVAIRAAAQQIGHWRLCDTTLYVTMEPCPMCAGAIINARVRRVVFGCPDLKAGAVTSLYTLLGDSRLNHQCEVSGGVLSDECAQRLKSFFARLRAMGKK